MNKFERIKAALNSKEVDRVPVSLWMHLSKDDINPGILADSQIEFTKKYDYDFIKLMPFGLYCVEDWGAQVQYFTRTNRPPIIKKYGIQSIEDWGKLKALPAYYGTYGKQLQLAQYVSDQVKGELPFVQTIFSPLTVARKLAGDRILLDMKERPELIKNALEVITETTINFVKANIEAGVDGFFFATQCASYDLLTEEEYKIFGEPFDLKVIESYNKETFLNIVHIHGDKIMFDLIKDYPVNCLNWHDRWTAPSLAKARTLTNKCLLGGVREVPYYDENNRMTRNSLLIDGTVNEVENHVKEAIEEVDGKGLIIGPGCVIDQATPEKSLFAVRRAVTANQHTLT